MKENQNIEWKQSWRDEYLKWIFGFANAQGGTLVIGKNDRGEVLGIASAAKMLADIPNKVRDILGMVVPVNLHNYGGKTVWRLGDGLGDGLGDSPQSLILRIIKAKPTISITELSKQLEISTTAVEKSLKRLKTKGLLKRIGLPKSGHWDVLV